MEMFFVATGLGLVWFSAHQDFKRKNKSHPSEFQGSLPDRSYVDLGMTEAENSDVRQLHPDTEVTDTMVRIYEDGKRHQRGLYRSGLQNMGSKMDPYQTHSSLRTLPQRFTQIGSTQSMTVHNTISRDDKKGRGLGRVVVGASPVVSLYQLPDTQTRGWVKVPRMMKF